MQAVLSSKERVQICLKRLRNVREGVIMKIHWIRKHAGLVLVTKCGLCFWPHINNYHKNDVVVNDKKKVTCKNCKRSIK